MINLANLLFNPATLVNSGTDAELILTPTWLTAVSTTKSNESPNLDWLTSY